MKATEAKPTRFLSQIELMAWEEGFQQGVLQNAREFLLIALEARFENVPPQLVEVINNIADISRLKQLLLADKTCPVKPEPICTF
jgi:hypothetical protein